MAKQKTQFVCTQCGYTSAKWSGKCLDCGSWNTMTEEEVVEAPKVSKRAGAASNSIPAKIYTFDKIPEETQTRLKTGIGELDRVLGGGIVPGCVALAGGEPGIGKSTLMLQAAQALTKYGSVLYVSGEESPSQIKMRATRLGITDNIYLMAETEIGSVLAGMERLNPKFVVLDSIQTMHDENLSSAPGSVSQVRGCASRITQAAKAAGTAVFIIGHVTKEGAIAGPRVLEHIVDTVLYFEGEKMSNLRVLRTVKNRFGSTDEIGVFEMRDVGMVEVKNPTLLPEGEEHIGQSGVSIFAATQGTRPMLLELQALCAHTQLAIPRRISSGMDVNRIYMLCAVLEKKIGVKLYNQDIFINVAGGIKVKEYASDLAVTVAIVSSLRNLSIGRDTAFIGEIGLAGEIRSVTQLSKRLSECEKLGMKRVFVPKSSMEPAMEKKRKMKVIGVRTLSDVLAQAFETENAT